MNNILFYFEEDTILLFGRKPGENTWIPSLKDFDIKIREIHNVALEGCPFAAGLIARLEVRIKTMRSEILGYTAQLEKKLFDANVEDSTTQFSYSIYYNHFCGMSAGLIEIVILLDRCRLQWNRCRESNLIDKKTTKNFFKIRHLFVGLRRTPFTYDDRGIRSWDQQGSPDWLEMDKILPSPDTAPYRPLYFGDDPIRSTRPVMKLVEIDHLNHDDSGPVAETNTPNFAGRLKSLFSP